MSAPTHFDGPVVAEFRKNSRESVQLRFTEYNEHRLVDIRVWYDREGSGDLRPGKGLSLRRELLPDLLKAVATARKADAASIAGDPDQLADA